MGLRLYIYWASDYTKANSLAKKKPNSWLHTSTYLFLYMISPTRTPGRLWLDCKMLDACRKTSPLPWKIVHKFLLRGITSDLIKHDLDQLMRKLAFGMLRVGCIWNAWVRKLSCQEPHGYSMSQIPRSSRKNPWWSPAYCWKKNCISYYLKNQSQPISNHQVIFKSKLIILIWEF